VTTDGFITSGSAIQLIQPFDALIRAKLNQFGGGARERAQYSRGSYSL
jgi:hypothetical protein